MIKWDDTDIHGKVGGVLPNSTTQINGPFITAKVVQINEGQWKVYINNLPLREPEKTLEDAKSQATAFISILIAETQERLSSRKSGPTKIVKKWLVD
jgi:hypothetical protein